MEELQKINPSAMGVKSESEEKLLTHSAQVSTSFIRNGGTVSISLSATSGSESKNKRLNIGRLMTSAAATAE